MSVGNIERLWEIARQYLAGERTYSAHHVVTKLELYLRIPRARAESGFLKMLQAGVLAPAPGDEDRYFLADSTPF